MISSKNALFAVLCVLLPALCSPASAVPAAPTPQAHRAAGMIVRNPHLKGVEPTASTSKHSAKKATQAAVHHTWHRRWDYHSWITLHRGLGTIRGFVHVPAGSGATSARVILRQANGRSFSRVSRKHITYTDAAGNFTMFGVRPGNYRVFAQRGKQKGHTQAAVHPGFTASVAVKI